MTPKISACLIMRDEAENLPRVLNSLRPFVDEVICLDTGSVDNSMDVARKLGADRVELFLECNDPETGLIADFAMARNRSFELATHQTCFWIDADDRLEGGEHLRELAEQMTGDLCQVMLEYRYAKDDAGRRAINQWRERLVSPRHRFTWDFPVHEVLVPKLPLEGGPLVTMQSDKVRLIHHKQDSKKPITDPERNLRILRKRYKDTGGGEPRTIYYLGTELLIAGHVGEALGLLRRYVELSHVSDDDRCMAALSISKCYRAIGDFNAAIEWASKALTMKWWKASYWEISKAAFGLAESGHDPEFNYRRSIWWAEQGLKLAAEYPGALETMQARNVFEDNDVHLHLNVALSRLGEIDGAIQSCEAGLAGYPDHPMLVDNMRIYKNIRGRRTITREVEGLVERGALSPQAGELIKGTVEGKLEGVEINFRGSDAASPEPTPPPPITPRTPEPGKLDIVFYVGHGLEPWSPATFAQTGLGGSETMAWELSHRLAARGHRVRLFGHCTPTMEGMYSGVEWLDASRYRNVECDALIASRRPEVVDDEHGLKAAARILWVHDLHCGENLTLQRDLRFDRVFALSQYHKRVLQQVYPLTNPDKIVVTRNGIDLTRFDGSEPRNPKRAVYSSSPDRGLALLLELWPKIREQVPDAELHLYYGFGNWMRTAQLFGWDDQVRLARHLEHLAKNTTGVFYHDRVNQKELAREFMRSGAMLSPCWFQESFGIAFAEAQTAGLRIVSSTRGALPETVGDRGVLLDYGDELKHPMDPQLGYREAFVEASVSALIAPEDQRWAQSKAFPDGWHRDELARHAREAFDLETLADDWGRLLTEIVEDTRSRVVPPFRAVEAA